MHIVKYLLGVDIGCKEPILQFITAVYNVIARIWSILNLPGVNPGIWCLRR